MQFIFFGLDYQYRIKLKAREILKNNITLNTNINLFNHTLLE